MTNHVRIRVSHRFLAAIVLVVVGGVVGYVAHAAIPDPASSLVYSGALARNGAPDPGPENIDIVLHKTATDASAGDILCSTSAPNTALVAGRFSIALDATCAPVVRTTPDAFVEVKVGGGPVGARTKIGAVPFAVEAEHATTADDVATLPAGAVMAFDLDACPPGWSAFAPAAGRAVVGTGSGLARGDTAGSNSVTLSVAQMPAHDHGGLTEPLGGGGGPTNFLNYGSGAGEVGFAYTGVDAASATTRLNELRFGIDSEGGGQPFDNRQASVALTYCRKD